MEIPKYIIVLLCTMVKVVNGLIIHVTMHMRIYAKVIFVSLLFYFVDNIIDIKIKMETKTEKKTQ
jgi:hypothetical protein